MDGREEEEEAGGSSMYTGKPHQVDHQENQIKHSTLVGSQFYEIMLCCNNKRVQDHKY